MKTPIRKCLRTTTDIYTERWLKVLIIFVTHGRKESIGIVVGGDSIVERDRLLSVMDVAHYRGALGGSDVALSTQPRCLHSLSTHRSLTCDTAPVFKSLKTHFNNHLFMTRDQLQSFHGLSTQPPGILLTATSGR